MKHNIDDTVFSVINAIPNPVIVLSNDVLQSANSTFLSFFNLSSIEEFNKIYGSVEKLIVKHNGFFSPTDIKDDEYWTDYLFARPQISRIISIINKDNDLVDFEITLKRIESKSEYIVVFNDITTYISEKNEYKYFAYHDHLTKIYNRQKFDELFLKAFENKKRYSDNLCLLLIDLDKFKKVNDTYGHVVGDLVLVAVVGVISKELRVNDVFARWGGEEFIIMLPRTDIDSAYKKAQEIRKSIESFKDKDLPSVTISIGVSEAKSSDDMNSCLKRVDDALYKAKEKRNDVVKIV